MTQKDSASLPDGESQQSSNKRPKLLHVTMVTISMVIGIAVLVTGEDAHWFVRGYLWDIACPIFAFSFVRLTSDLDSISIALAALAVLTLWEFAQLFLSNYSFDPWDLAAYAAGIGIALVLESIAHKFQTPDKRVNRSGDSYESDFNA